MKFSVKLTLALAAGASILMAAEPALAQVTSQSALTIPTSGKSLGDVAGSVTNSLKGASSLVVIICYLGALVFGLMGAMKWKAHGEQPERTPFKIPVIYWAIAVLLAGFPEFLGTGITTLWGDGANVVQQP